MATAWFYALVAGFVIMFLFCAVDVAFCKNFNVGENVTSVVVLIGAYMFLLMACAVTGNTSGEGLFGKINEALGECLPFYDFITNSGNYKNVLDYGRQFPREFAEEFVQTVFMATLVPLINKLFPTIIAEERLINRVMIRLAANLMVVAIAMVLYHLFQLTTVSQVAMDLIVGCFSVTPLVQIGYAIKTRATEYGILAVLAALAWKALCMSIIYLFLANFLAANFSQLITAVTVIYTLIPSLLTIAIMLLGIGLMFRSFR